MSEGKVKKKVNQDGRWDGGEAPPGSAWVPREQTGAAAVWGHPRQDRSVALSSRIGEPTPGSDFGDERGRGAAKCRHRLKLLPTVRHV